MATSGQVQARRPSAVALAAENEDGVSHLHATRPLPTSGDPRCAKGGHSASVPHLLRQRVADRARLHPVAAHATIVAFAMSPPGGDILDGAMARRLRKAALLHLV